MVGHRRCVLGDKDPECEEQSLVHLVEVFSRQILNDDFDEFKTADCAGRKVVHSTSQKG